MKRFLAFLVLVAIVFVATAAVVMQSTSTRVLYASQMGCSLNSDVINGGGTDDSAALQAALNLAAAKGYEFIVDGPALISTNLILRSNTKLTFLPGSGLFMAPGASHWMFGNAQNTNYTSTNIVVQGGILNCNGNNHSEYVNNGHQNSGDPGTWGIWFAGVNGLIVRDVKIMSCKTYAILINDSRNALFENITCSWTNNPAVTNTYYGTDCFHAQCNVTNIHVNGLNNFHGSDDTFALMTDETDLTLNVNDPRWTINSGAMKDILIENVYLDKGDTATYPRNVGKFQAQGSTNAILENVTLRNIHGSVLQNGIHSGNSGGDGFVRAKNLRIEGFIVSFSVAFDQLNAPAISLAGLSCDTMCLSDIVINDPDGAGMGNVALISVSARATNVFISNAYFQGSAGSVSSGDTALIVYADPNATGTFETNAPTICLDNVTALRLAGIIQNDGNGNGVIRMNNIQRIRTPSIATSTFTNITTGEPITSAAAIPSGIWFTNQTGRPITVSQSFSITEAAVAGCAVVHFITGQQGAALGTWQTNASYGQMTLSTSLVTTNVGQITCVVSNSMVYCFTNQLVGAGNSITPRPNTSMVVTY